LTLLFDAQGERWQHEVSALRDLDPNRRLRFVDVSVPGFDPRPYRRALADLQSQIHALVSCQGSNATCSLALKPDGVVASGRHSPGYDSSSRLASGLDSGAIKRHLSPDTTLAYAAVGKSWKLPLRKMLFVGPLFQSLGWVFTQHRHLVSRHPLAWLTKACPVAKPHPLAHETRRAPCRLELVPEVDASLALVSGVPVLSDAVEAELPC
jgi:hypothetical protein